MPEFRRIVQRYISPATADDFKIATPANWPPGYDVIVPPAGSCGVAKERMERKDECVKRYGGFFCTKKLDRDTLLKKILKK